MVSDRRLGRRKRHAPNLPVAEEGGVSLFRRVLICLALATWCFADTWVEYAEGNVTYFARHDPVHAVVIPVIALQAIFTLGLLAGWEFCRRKRICNWPAVHFFFLAICLPS